MDLSGNLYTNTFLYGTIRLSRLGIHNSYLSYRIINSFSWILKLFFLAPRDQRPEILKLDLILWFFLYLWKIVWNTILCIIFSMAENQRILIGFAALLGNKFVYAVKKIRKFMTSWSMKYTIQGDHKLFKFAKYNAF